MAESWRDEVVERLTQPLARLTLAADPDGVVTEEGVGQALRDHGIELLLYGDPIAFRFAYESRYRARWDRGEPVSLLVVVPRDAGALHGLPYDVVQAGRTVSLSLGDLFPHLSYPVVAALDRADLDALYQAQLLDIQAPLGEAATREYVLRRVFDVDPRGIGDDADLLRLLLRRHYRGQYVPAPLDEYLIGVLRGRFADWPLERIVPDRDAFLTFLQERWPAFLDRLAGEESQASGLRETKAAYTPAIPGPINLPFDHDDVRPYVDSLFLGGLLRPVQHDCADALSRSWAGVGLHADRAESRTRRLEGLLRAAEDAAPPAAAAHREWLRFAQLWAQLVVARHGSDAAEQRDRFIALRAAVDDAFSAWVQDRYTGLHNLPAQPPVMLHHVTRALAAQLGQPGHERIALVVVDGLALDQWLILREVLEQQRTSLSYHEGAVFSWLPTITPVARQSLFSGKAPMYFKGSIGTTDREPALWMSFWEGDGLQSAAVAYARALGTDASLERVEDVLSSPRVRVVGLVVDMVDKIMHGMQLGTAGMHNQVRQWAKRGVMARLLDLLLQRGFAVHLTADHGNVEATGFGRPSDGVLGEVTGLRARVYADEMLREHVCRQFPTAITWPPIGLPDDYLPLLAPGRCAFADKEKLIVAHGGMSIEELIVPYISITSGVA